MSGKGQRPLCGVSSPTRGVFSALGRMALPFAFGVVGTTAVFIFGFARANGTGQRFAASSGPRIVAPPPDKFIDPNLIDPETQSVRKWQRVGSLDDLLKLRPDELEKVDIAEMNLLCATGLPGAEDIKISEILLRLDGFASSVRFQTNRHLYRVKDPKYADHYKHSENVLRAEFLVQVLQEDCGVHYNLQRVRDVDFTNSQDLFIHGLMGPNGGTCASMPVLYVAIGRRLGYPMSVAVAPGHVLARWDSPDSSSDPMKHFNAEGTGYGFSPLDDEYFRNWPRKMSERDRQCGFFLRPLSAAEVLANFLQMRGHCLLDTGRFDEAMKAYEVALRLAPKDPYAAGFVAQAENRKNARQFALVAKTASTRSATSRPAFDPREQEELARYVEQLNEYNRRLNQQRIQPPNPGPSYGQRPPGRYGPQSPTPASPYGSQPGFQPPYQPPPPPVPPRMPGQP